MKWPWAGSPVEPRTGHSLLIREGAALVQSAADVIELPAGLVGALRLVLRDTASGWSDDGDAADKSADITALLTTAPVAVDEHIRQTGAASAAVRLGLLELEQAGRLVRHAGGRVSLVD